MSNSITSRAATRSSPFSSGIRFLKSTIIRYLIFAGLVSVLLSSGVFEGHSTETIVVCIVGGSFLLRGLSHLFRQGHRSKKKTATNKQSINCDGMSLSDIAILNAYAKVREGGPTRTGGKRVEALSHSDFDADAIELFDQ